MISLIYYQKNVRNVSVHVGDDDYDGASLSLEGCGWVRYCITESLLRGLKKTYEHEQQCAFV